MKIHYSLKEKEQILSLVKIWRREQLSQGVFRDIQLEFGIPPTLIETMFWHLDTLYQLSRLEKAPVFKGGTCVQSYLPFNSQRASNDLDFNSQIANPNSILDQIRKLNERLLREGAAVITDNISYGTIELCLKDDPSGVLNFNRRMPSLLGEYVKVGNSEVLAKNIRIQINYKHAWLSALHVNTKKIEFFISRFQAPQKSFVYPCSSLEDLIADKILAAMNNGGRERFKDAYDLILLFMQGYRKDKILEKLEIVSRRKGYTADTILKSSANTISNLAEKDIEAQGFGSLVCRGGKEIIKNWGMDCIALVGKILDLG